MENTAIQDFERLEKLAKSKNFNQLNSQEKEWILSFQTESEYNALTDFYKNTSKNRDFNEIEPEQFTKAKLDAAFEATKKRSNSFIIRKIPFYQSVAAAFVFLLAGFWISYSVKKINNSHVTAQEIVRDTIQVIQYVQTPYLPLSVVQNRILTQAGLKVINNENDLFVDTLYHVTENVFVTNKNQRTSVINLLQKDSQNSEKSLFADTILKKMLIVLY